MPIKDYLRPPEAVRNSSCRRRALRRRVAAGHRLVVHSRIIERRTWGHRAGHAALVLEATLHSLNLPGRRASQRSKADMFATGHT